MLSGNSELVDAMIRITSTCLALAESFNRAELQDAVFSIQRRLYSTMSSVYNETQLGGVLHTVCLQAIECRPVFSHLECAGTLLGKNQCSL